MDKNCTVYRTAGYIGKKWTMPILLELHKGNGARRYSHIKKSLPRITSKILSTRLKELEREGLVAKKIDADSMPVKCEYRLTKSGSGFIEIIKGMKLWALKWKVKNEACRNLDCRKCKL